MSDGPCAAAVLAAQNETLTPILAALTTPLDYANPAAVALRIEQLSIVTAYLLEREKELTKTVASLLERPRG